MLLQTNSYVVPKDRRAEHARLLRRFRQTLMRLGCEYFEVYEQAGQNWGTGESGRFVQIMKFRDRRQQLAVQAAERSDPQAQQLIAEFCELINFPYQQQHGLFAVGFYNSVLPVGPHRLSATLHEAAEDGQDEVAAVQAVAAAEVAPPDQQTYVAAAQPAAEFSGEPVVPPVEPIPAIVETAEETAQEPVATGEESEAQAVSPVAEEVAPAAPEAAEMAPAEEPDQFRNEMEALGAGLDDEPMRPVGELEQAQAEPDLQGLAVDLPDEQEHPAAPVADIERAGEPSGNGEVASRNGDEAHEAPHELETVLVDEVRPSEPAEDHGAFESLLDDEPDSLPGNDSSIADHGRDESALEATGSGIGAVLDGLDDADLDVALPAELIEDELEPHAPDAHPKSGHAGDRT